MNEESGASTIGEISCKRKNWRREIRRRIK
jgi:hypothetical protein